MLRFDIKRYQQLAAPSCHLAPPFHLKKANSFYSLLDEEREKGRSQILPCSLLREKGGPSAVRVSVDDGREVCVRVRVYVTVRYYECVK